MCLTFTPTKFLLTVMVFLYHTVLSYAQVSYEEAFPNISFNVPVEIQNAADGSNRLFVVEQSGTIKVFPNRPDLTAGQVSNFADLSQKVAYSAGQEIGLLGLAFHPQFTTNGYVFVYYIDRPGNYRINIVRYQVSSSNPNQIDTNTETIIAQYTKNQGESNHNGGKIAFGPDGYLYASIGDGGGGGDPQGNAQNLNTVFGSILRLDIDIDGNNPIETNPELPNGNYEIPSDNPRVGQSGLDELYAWGIRNTWKFSFDRLGRLWGADVGQNAFEEINLITNGGNFGWNRFEGSADFRPSTALISNPDIKPVLSYGHSEGDKSITGGYVYSGSLASSALRDKYVYGDFLTGRVWALTYNPITGAASSELLFRANGQSISSFGEDEAGELYFSSYGTSAKLFKLSETVTGPVVPVITGIGGWKEISTGTNGTVASIAIAGDNTTYVGGNFSNAGNLDAANLTLVTPEGQWQSFGAGSNGTVNAIAVAQDGTIVVGGEFSQIGGVTVNNIAFWNGSSWSAMGSGTNGAVQALKFDANGILYVGGVFSTANDQTVNNIAQWQNNVWSALTESASGIAGTNNEVRSLGMDENNNLYIGGNFDTAGGVSASRIARWNGTNWTALGEGTSGFVQAIEIMDGYVYAGGNFNIAGNTTVNRIARYNLTNSTWESLGFGVSGSVNAIATDGEYIYAGGDFETASNAENSSATVNNAARWSPALGWQALGLNSQVGVNSSIATMRFSDATGTLYLGGTFTSAGDIAANNIAIWSEAFCSANSVIPEYQVNGSWESGDNTLSLNQGDTLTLSILPNNLPFTILLPNGETRQGDYSLGSFTGALAGTYVFTSELGCTESLEILINGAPNEDIDNDGVLNANDLCPNTPPGTEVNSSGCGNNSFPANQFSISTLLNSCETDTEGQININTLVAGNYLAVLTDSTQNSSNYPFTDTLNIPQLTIGNYILCITETGSADTQSCFSLTIDPSSSLQVQSVLNETGTSVTLNLNGARKYFIALNEKRLETASNEITIELDKDINTLQISSDNTCQLPYSETILTKDAFVVYPNPIDNFVSIDVSRLTDEVVEIALFSATGNLLLNQKSTTENPVITIDTSSLSSGYFILRLTGESVDKAFKLIK